MIFIAAFPSTYSEQSLQQEQEYVNQKSYYLSQGCNPETIDSTGHVLTWRCPAGTESAEERLFTGNLTTNELCYGDKYVNTKAYAQSCSDIAKQLKCFLSVLISALLYSYMSIICKS